MNVGIDINGCSFIPVPILLLLAAHETTNSADHLTMSKCTSDSLEEAKGGASGAVLVLVSVGASTKDV